MNARIQYGVSFAAYAAIDAINWHTLEPFRKSARHGRHQMLLQREASEAMVLGEALHCAILEPERFAAQYAAEPRFEGHPNSNAYKAQRDAWRSEHATSVLLTWAEYQDVRAMAAAAREHPVAGAVLAARGKNELSITWSGKDGATMKARLDRVCRVPASLLYPTSPDRGGEVICLCDVKTTRAIAPVEFERELARFGYHGQLAMYADALTAADPSPFAVAILAVENTPPYDVAVYRVDDEVIDHGRKLYRRLLALYQQCQKDGHWPGVAPCTTGIELPAYARERDGGIAEEELEVAHAA